MIYNDIHALQQTSVQVRGRESPSLSPLVLSDGNPVRPVLLGSFSCVGLAHLKNNASSLTPSIKLIPSNRHVT